VKVTAYQTRQSSSQQQVIKYCFYFTMFR